MWYQAVGQNSAPDYVEPWGAGARDELAGGCALALTVSDKDFQEADNRSFSTRPHPHGVAGDIAWDPAVQCADDSCELPGWATAAIENGKAIVAVVPGGDNAQAYLVITGDVQWAQDTIASRCDGTLGPGEGVLWAAGPAMRKRILSGETEPVVKPLHVLIGAGVVVGMLVLYGMKKR